MEQGRKHFEKHEENISNTFMSAAGANDAPPLYTRPGGHTDGYKLFTSQYFIGIGVGMLLGYFVLPKILKK